MTVFDNPGGDPIVTFDLPAPPSVNAMYANAAGARGRIKTPHYKAWVDEAGYTTRVSLPANWLAGKDARYRVFLSANITRKRDLDNLIKPILDWLKTMSVITDDRYVDALLVRRDKDYEVRRGRVRVVVSCFRQGS